MIFGVFYEPQSVISENCLVCYTILFYEVYIAYVPKIKKPLAIIVESSQFMLNTSKISCAMELNRTTLLSYKKSLTDAIETGMGSKIPLWLFGFLY